MSTSTITLVHPAHGQFKVDADVLSLAVAQLGSASLGWLRAQAAGHAGYPEQPFSWVTALDDCSRIECLIIWVESGNHTFDQ